MPSQLHWKLKAGVIAEQRRLSLNADADSKMGHYHHAGATIAEAFAEAGVAPPRRRYFGKGGEVLERLQEGSRVEASGPTGEGHTFSSSGGGGEQVQGCHSMSTLHVAAIALHAASFCFHTCREAGA